jgi:hypothetical protein
MALRIAPASAASSLLVPRFRGAIATYAFWNQAVGISVPQFTFGEIAMKKLLLSTVLLFATGSYASAADYYQLEVRHSNKCLHQHGGTQGNGDRITQWDCVNQPNVKVEVLPAGGNFHFLRFQHSGKCVHQHGGTQGNGDAITQWDCVNQPNVKVEIVPAGGQYYFLRFQHSGKCVHQHGGTQGNGDAITQWDCVNQPNVMWKFVRLF